MKSHGAPNGHDGTLDPRLWFLALETFAIGTDVFVITGILPAIATDLKITLSTAGAIVTGYALTYALGAPLLVPFTARFRQGRVAISSLALFSAANALCALTPASLMFARIVAGRRTRDEAPERALDVRHPYRSGRRLRDTRAVSAPVGRRRCRQSCIGRP